MRAGVLRKRVTIQAPTQGAADEFGAPLAGWTSLGTVWAEVRPLTGREMFQAQMVTADVSHRITLRYRGGVTPACRATLGSRVFHFLDVRDVEERNRTLEIDAQEQT